MASISNRVFADPLAEFDGVAARYSPVLFRIALKRLRNVEDAEDAVQDALLSAYKHIGQFEGRSQLSSWLTRIVINTAGMKLRSRWRQDAAVSLDQAAEEGGEPLASELVCARPNPETRCAQTEAKQRLHQALTHISPKLRVAFEMREIAGFSTKETAQVMGITTSSLKSRVKRARAAVSLYIAKANKMHSADESTMPKVRRAANSRDTQVSFPTRTAPARVN